MDTSKALPVYEEHRINMEGSKRKCKWDGFCIIYFMLSLGLHIVDILKSAKGTAHAKKAMQGERSWEI